MARSIPGFSMKRLTTIVYVLLIVLLFAGNAMAMVPKLPSEKFLALIRQNHLHFVDFVKYYLCGKVAYTDSAHTFYSYATQNELFKQISGGVDLEKAQGIEFPPYVLPLLYPLARLPLDTAFIVWWLINWSMVGVGIFCISRINPKLKSPATVLAFCLAVFSIAPMLRSFMVGQPTGILLGLFSLYAFCLVKKKELPAGILLGLTAVKPQYAIFLAVPPLVTRRFKVIGTAAATGLALLLMAISAQGAPAVAGYLQYVLHIDTAENLAGSLVLHMVNLRGLVSPALPEKILSIVTVISLLAGLGMTGKLWMVHGKKQAESGEDTAKPERWLMALTVLSALFLGPHTHMYDCVLLALPLALTMEIFTPAGAFAITDWRLKLYHLLAIFYPVITWLIAVNSFPVRETYLAFVAYTILNAFFILLCALRCLQQESGKNTQSE